MDPRVKISRAELKQQFMLSVEAYEGYNKTNYVVAQIENMKSQIKDLATKAGQGTLADSLNSFARNISQWEGGGGRRFRRITEEARPSFRELSGEMLGLMDLFQGADAPPTTQGVSAIQHAKKALEELNQAWEKLEMKDLRALNGQIRKAGLPEIVVERARLDFPVPESPHADED